VRNGCLAFALALAAGGTASAQQLRPGSIATAVRSSSALSPAEPPRAADTAADRRIVIATANDPRDDSARIANQILQRLPLARVQHLLRTNPMLRVAEVAVGASLVGFQIRQSSMSDATSSATVSPLAQIGVQALRYSGAEWLERPRFRIEPEVRPGGFAVYFKRTH
jgi:hypothetical protein